MPPGTRRRLSGQTSSTASSIDSSTASPPGQFRYRSPEYRALVAGPLDPLVHPTPMEPARFYLLIRRLARWVVTHLFRVTVTGLENIPTPPYIIAANHQAWFDPAFIIPFFPERPLIYTMAKRETVFNRAWKRRLLPLIGVFPISPNKGELDEHGLRTVYQVLERNGVMLIFPEGHYSRGRALRPLTNGIGYFALHAGVPICPVAVRGADSLWPFHRVEVSIAAPIKPDLPAWWELSRRVTGMVENVRNAITTALTRRRE